MTTQAQTIPMYEAKPTTTSSKMKLYFCIFGCILMDLVHPGRPRAFPYLASYGCS
jgi:hypothetical protein